MTRIRIMHVVRSLDVGGAEGGVRKLLVGLDRNIFEQVVCSVLSGPPCEPQTGTRVISLGRSPAKSSGLLVPDLTRVLIRERPQIVHSRNWGAIEAVPAARLARVSGVVHSEHGLDVESMNGQPWRRRVFRRLCFSWTDRAFAVSRGLRDHYIKQLGIPASRLGIVPNGVDTEQFRANPRVRAERRGYLGVDQGTLVVGTVSRLDPVKAHRVLLDAAERAVSCGVKLKLIIVGDGPERSSLNHAVESSPVLRGRTLFVGETREVAAWMNSFDVFALPSLAEGMSNTLLEAMAVGVAPVASRVGGNPEVIEEGRSGLLFDAGDAEALAAYIRALALDVQLRQSLGKTARNRVEAVFSLPGMLQNYARMYSEVVERNGVVQPAFGCA